MPFRRPTTARLNLLLALTLAVTLAALPGCTTYVYDGVTLHDVSVDNRTGITLDIYVDGSYRLTVTSGTTGTLRDLSRGFHTLEAFDLDGQLRASRQVDLDRDFLWILE